MSAINQGNVGRIAERIVANELEFLGFRVNDLNHDGTSANADLLAVRSDRICQVQVKGATNTEEDQGWWFNYGACTDAIIHRQERMFNRKSSFYTADVVILVAVKSPREYKCLVLPLEVAEKAVEINLNREFRTLTRQGTPKKPHKVWVGLDIPSTRNNSRKALFIEELRILEPHLDNWEFLRTTNSENLAG